MNIEKIIKTYFKWEIITAIILGAIMFILYRQQVANTNNTETTLPLT